MPPPKTNRGGKNPGQDTFCNRAFCGLDDSTAGAAPDALLALTDPRRGDSLFPQHNAVCHRTVGTLGGRPSGA